MPGSFLVGHTWYMFYLQMGHNSSHALTHQTTVCLVKGKALLYNVTALNNGQVSLTLVRLNMTRRQSNTEKPGV